MKHDRRSFLASALALLGLPKKGAPKKWTCDGVRIADIKMKPDALEVNPEWEDAPHHMTYTILDEHGVASGPPVPYRGYIKDGRFVQVYPYRLKG